MRRVVLTAMPSGYFRKEHVWCIWPGVGVRHVLADNFLADQAVDVDISVHAGVRCTCQCEKAFEYSDRRQAVDNRAMLAAQLHGNMQAVRGNIVKMLRFVDQLIHYPRVIG